MTEETKLVAWRKSEYGGFRGDVNDHDAQFAIERLNETSWELTHYGEFVCRHSTLRSAKSTAEEIARGES